MFEVRELKIDPKRPVLETFLGNKLGYNNVERMDEASKNYIIRNLLLTLFHKQSSAQFRSSVKKVAEGNTEFALALAGLRPELMQDVLINKMYKLALINQLNGDSVWNLTNLYPASHDELATSLDHDSLESIKATARNIPIKQPTIKDQDNLLEHVLIGISPFLKKFAGTKLRFISTSNNYQVYDLVNELKVKTIQTCRWVYPFRTKDHIFNCCKKSAHNAGINMIYHWTSKKRARLTETDQGDFQNRQIFIQGEGGNEQISLPNLPDNSVDIDQRLSFESLMNRFEGRDRLMLRLLSQDDTCEPFLRWCNRQLEAEFDSLEDIVQRHSWKRYIRLVSTYTECSDAKVNSFLGFLRRQCA